MNEEKLEKKKIEPKKTKKSFFILQVQFPPGTIHSRESSFAFQTTKQSDVHSVGDEYRSTIVYV